MMRDMMKWCCGPNGEPDFDKMTEFMTHHERASKYAAAGWALFFVWVAAITLSMQALRKTVGVRVEGFWVLVGLGFGVAGLWR